MDATTQVARFNANYSAKSDQTKYNIIKSFCFYFCKSTSAQNTTAASLHVLWDLVKATKPFADAPLIKMYANDIDGKVLGQKTCGGVG